MRKSDGIIFYHIPKCGGTSIHKVIREQILNGDYFQTPGSEKETKKYRGVGGHFLYGKEPKNILHDDINYHAITLLRNPVERIVSFYQFVMSIDKPHYLKKKAKDQGYDLKKFTLNDFVRFCIDIDNLEISNLQTKYICGSNVALSSGAALEKLKSEFLVWGMVEDMKGFVSRLGDELGVVLKEEKENVTKKPDISKKDEELIEIYNELDLLLLEKVQTI